MDIFSRFSISTEHFWRNLAIRSGLVIVTTILIVWFLPRNETKQFAYEVGEPWHYGTIIAKYDFPVYKTEEAIEKEKDSLLKQFQPYYNFDPNVEVEEINKLRRKFAQGGSGLPSGFESIIIQRLHRFYQAGIMETPNYNALHRDTAAQVRVVFGKDAESVQIGYLYSTMSAYEQLLSDELLSQERPLVQKLNLTDYIVPNLIFDSQRTETARNDLLAGVSPASGMVMAGQRIIGQGDLVDEYSYRVLNSMEKEMQRRQVDKTQLTNHIVGNSIYVFILVL